ncbi:unnamed protein product [Discula destructiva]
MPLTGKFPSSARAHDPSSAMLICRVLVKVDICNTTITLDPVSGAWYTGSESAPVESGICDKLGVNGTGVASASCETAAFESRSIFTDLLSCSTDVCDGF